MNYMIEINFNVLFNHYHYILLYATSREASVIPNRFCTIKYIFTTQNLIN